MRIVYTALNGDMAGGQQVCLVTMQAVLARGHTVCLVISSRGAFTEAAESLGIPVFLLPMQRTFHFHRAWQFARLLKSWRADLVHCHHMLAGVILARLACAWARVPLIVRIPQACVQREPLVRCADQP
jgi:hypothetical protein